METNLYTQLYSYENLLLAFKNARKRKTLKDYVHRFENNLNNNLLQLKMELLFHAYHPKPLKTFILRDPKTRTISKSDFRDRIIHHALCNIIEPPLEKQFIHDSFANQKGKGTFAAIKRFEYFKRKVSHNFSKINKDNNIKGFIFKGDVKHFFETVNHGILIKIIKKTIKDDKVIWLIKTILSNYESEITSIGMPLGNLTSQFFANVYLNELDQFVKHKLRAKYYIRYVDDFVILHRSKEQLIEYQEQIKNFLGNELELQLHPEKSKIFPLYYGTTFLGLRVFPFHKSIRKKNLRKFQQKYKNLCQEYNSQKINYDKIYDFLEGWIAYAKNANTYKLRKKVIKIIDKNFAGEISSKEINRFLNSFLLIHELDRSRA